MSNILVAWSRGGQAAAQQQQRPSECGDDVVRPSADANDAAGSAY